MSISAQVVRSLQDYLPEDIYQTIPEWSLIQWEEKLKRILGEESELQENKVKA